MSKTIGDLRDHLFDTLSMLKSGDENMDVEKAKTICDIGQTIINSGKLEVEAMKVTGANRGTGFLPELPGDPSSAPGKGKLLPGQPPRPPVRD